MNQDFITGINYWPSHKAMYWWRNFAQPEVDQDFARLAQARFQVVRIFLLWEDFQPYPDQVPIAMLDKLKQVADIAQSHGLKIMPTFFCGHMSGVNWLPSWMISPTDKPQRFLVYSREKLQQADILNFYADTDLALSQSFQIDLVGAALKGHAALYAYDLGNETSNCVIPLNHEQGQRWLDLMVTTIKKHSPDIPVTLGLHAEDLEEDRNLSPRDAALFCDFLSMHAYPFYLNWVDDPQDVYLVPFLGAITSWLGNKPVLLQEFGLPNLAATEVRGEAELELSLKTPLFMEKETVNYYQKVMELLFQLGFLGALPWCFADYDPELWRQPPLDHNTHERYFGLFQYDGRPKKMVGLFNEAKYLDPTSHYHLKDSWNRDFQAENFYTDPRNNLIKMFSIFKQHLV